jgi:hypothetical protein
MTGSSDADDDKSDTHSEDSLSFISKKKRKDRERPLPSVGLGLSLGVETAAEQASVQVEEDWSRAAFRWLRWGSIVPACYGIFVLALALLPGGMWRDVWPWGFDVSAEALEARSMGQRYHGEWLRADRGDMILAIIWVSCRHVFPALQYCRHRCTAHDILPLPLLHPMRMY